MKTRSLGLLVAALLCVHPPSAAADPPVAKPRCVPQTVAQQQQQTRRYNDGLPALGTMMMAGAAGGVLVTLLGTTLGALATAERAENPVEGAAGALGAVLVFSVGMVASTGLGLLGFGIWFVAWLPPVRSTLRRCAPEPSPRPAVEPPAAAPVQAPAEAPQAPQG